MDSFQTVEKIFSTVCFCVKRGVRTSGRNTTDTESIDSILLISSVLQLKVFTISIAFFYFEDIILTSLDEHVALPYYVFLMTINRISKIM